MVGPVTRQLLSSIELVKLVFNTKPQPKSQQDDHFFVDDDEW